VKILICTKNDIFGALILNRLLSGLSGHELKVFLSDKTRPTENIVPELIDERFLERETPVDTLFTLVDEQSQGGDLLTFVGLARRYDIGIEKIYDVNDRAVELTIREWNPEIIVSARFSLIFKSNIFSIPRGGTFNVHPGKLPGYAGLMAPLHALLNYEAQLGCTVHRIDEGIDTGPVYSVSCIAADATLSVFEHTVRLYDLGLISLLDLISGLDRGRVPTLTTQNRSDFRYFHLPGEREFFEARRKSISMFHLPSYVGLLCRFLPSNISPRSVDCLNIVGLEQAMSARRLARSANLK
jgi:hypothetical protein